MSTQQETWILPSHPHKNSNCDFKNSALKPPTCFKTIFQTSNRWFSAHIAQISISILHQRMLELNKHRKRCNVNKDFSQFTSKCRITFVLQWMPSPKTIKAVNNWLDDAQKWFILLKNILHLFHFLPKSYRNYLFEKHQSNFHSNIQTFFEIEIHMRFYAKCDSSSTALAHTNSQWKSHFQFIKHWLGSFILSSSSKILPEYSRNIQ